MAAEIERGKEDVAGDGRKGSPYRAVIFDVDGTLVDTNERHADAWVEALGAFGFETTRPQVLELVGMGSDKLIPVLTGLEASAPEGSAIASLQGEIFRSRYAPTARPTRGARALIERLQEEGFALATATSAAKEEMQCLLRLVGLDDAFDELTSSSDAQSSKPDPDILQAALKRLGVNREEAVFVGDTPYDVLAALRAGVDCIALRCGGWRDVELAGALAIYDDPQDLLRRLSASPLLKGRPVAERSSRATGPGRELRSEA